jgi:microcin C transport system substrate-binding protein
MMLQWVAFCHALALSFAFASGMNPLLAAEPPLNLRWETNANPPLIASPEAVTGGRIIASIDAFPLTLRQVGPDSPSSFRTLLDDNDMSLVTLHPNTDAWMPMLATHWAFDPDGRTVYYRLNPAARWSDQKPLKATDFTYTLEFMRSPHIQSPWSNEYYTKTIESIQTFEEKAGTEVIAIRLAQPTLDRLLMTNIKPMPRHFYGQLDANFVTTFNWKIPPNLGPYALTTLDKGKRVVFQRKKDWWAKDMPYFKHRYNVDEVVLKVVRDVQVAFEYLKAGDLDIMAVLGPDLWKAADTDDVFAKGYIHRLQAYNDQPRSDYALILNSSYGPFQDERVRQAFAHSMNVQRVIDELLKDGYQRLQGISQGYGPYTARNIKARPFDLAKADELFKQAGWGGRNAEGIRIKDGKTLTATITYGQSNLTPRFVILQEDARKAGIDLKLQLMDPAQAFKSFRDKAHQIAFVAWSTSYRPEYRARFHSSFANKPQTSNYSNTASPVLDQLIEEYEHASDDRKRIEKAHAIQNFVFQDSSYIPLFEVPYYRLAYWSWIQFPAVPGTKSTDGLSFFDSATGGLFWIDRDRQASVNAARKRGERFPARTWIDDTFRVK